MSFLEEYFINPILSNGWFNPVNTAVYSIGLIIGVYLVYRLLMKLKINIDRYFFLSLLPFIFWGSSTRVLHDAAVAGALSPELNAFYISPFFPTPGSYFITFGLALGILLVSLVIQRFTRFPYWKPMLAAGTLLCILNIWLLPIVNLLPLYLILGTTVIWTLLFFLPVKFLPKYFTRENTLILGGHFLDASATFFALTMFGYLEQHVLPRLLMPVFGEISMFVLKVIVVVPALIIIDRYAENRTLRNLLKIVVLILGLAPGLRDLLRLIAMV